MIGYMKYLFGFSNKKEEVPAPPPQPPAPVIDVTRTEPLFIFGYNSPTLFSVPPVPPPPPAQLRYRPEAGSLKRVRFE